MMKIFSKSLLVLYVLLIFTFIIWYSNVGSENQYYIEGADIYIKTFPSRETTIIAFSDNRINKFSDTLDYIKVNKGDNYSTDILLDPNKKNMIYILGNSLTELHLQKHEMGEEISSRDTVYFEYKEEGGYLLKTPYVYISFMLIGSTERVYLKNREDLSYTEIKPIK